MGACVSFSRSPLASPAAEASHSQRAPPAAAEAATVRVVNLDGSMAQHAGPVTAREALPPRPSGADGAHRHRVPSPPRHFLCSSDELGFDVPPHALAAGEALHPGQLYFVLPAAALRRPLSGEDMAALAVRASTALAAAGGLSPRRDRQAGGRTTPAGKRRRRRQSTARVAPLLVAVSKRDGDGGAPKNDVLRGGYAAARPAVQDGERTVGRTRKGAAGYRTGGGSRHRAVVVQRLSAIAEDGE